MEILKIGDLDEFKLFGYTLKQMEHMRVFAISHGWKPREEKSNG